MDRYVFAVGEKMYCCWDPDLAESNGLYLLGLRSNYWDYLARVHLGNLNGAWHHHASIALRAGYYHGLETFFSLLCAFLQAPGAVPAWIPNCTNVELRELVRKLEAGGEFLTQEGRRWESLAGMSKLVHAVGCGEDESASELVEQYARLWRHFSEDFLDKRVITEYNSIKHGHRLAAGGFSLEIGTETVPGVESPSGSLQSVGQSRDGTSFFDPARLSESSKNHFRLSRKYMNWRADQMAQRLQLLGWSINNVVSALCCHNGACPDDVCFYSPEDITGFPELRLAWDCSVGVPWLEVEFDINSVELRLDTVESLRSELESRGGASDD